MSIDTNYRKSMEKFANHVLGVNVIIFYTRKNLSSLFFIVLSSGNNWDAGLDSDADGLVSFKAKNVSLHGSIGNIDQYRTQGCVAFFTVFLERGIYSGHNYMAECVNHRDLDINNWSSKQPGKAYTLIESFVGYSDMSVRFDVGESLIAMHLCTIVDTAKDVVDFDSYKYWPIKTAHDVNHVVNNNLITAPSVARDRLLQAITGPFISPSFTVFQQRMAERGWICES
jgi:hypothetical protein